MAGKSCLMRANQWVGWSTKQEKKNKETQNIATLKRSNTKRTQVLFYAPLSQQHSSRSRWFWLKWYCNFPNVLVCGELCTRTHTLIHVCVWQQHKDTHLNLEGAVALQCHSNSLRWCVAHNGCGSNNINTYSSWLLLLSVAIYAIAILLLLGYNSESLLFNAYALVAQRLFYNVWLALWRFEVLWSLDAQLAIQVMNINVAIVWSP